MANTIRSSLALAVFMLACGGDDGGDGLTLEAALQTAGTDSSDERAELLFEAACKKQIVCEGDSQSDCETSGLNMYNAGKKAGYDAACLDATLDLYACFAKNACADFDTACNDAGEAQDTACDKFTTPP